MMGVPLDVVLECLIESGIVALFLLLFSSLHSFDVQQQQQHQHRRSEEGRLLSIDCSRRKGRVFYIFIGLCGSN